MISIHEAIDAVLAAVRPLPAEEVPLLEALGRATADGDRLARGRARRSTTRPWTATPCAAPSSRPGAGEFKVVVEIPAGRWVGEEVGAGEAAKIMTGAPLPPGRRHRGAGGAHRAARRDARRDGAGAARRQRAPRRRGRRRRRRPLPARRASRPGRDRPARVGELSSTSPSPAGRGSRSWPPAASCGCRASPWAPGRSAIPTRSRPTARCWPPAVSPCCSGIARDDLDETRRLLAAALEHDVVITSGGVSVGEFDFVKQVQDELGVERRFWGVATKPGKPLAFGTRGDTLVFGVPGNPVAAMVSFEMYVRPALLALQGRPDLYRPYVFAAAEEPVRGSRDRTEARRCRLLHRGRGWGFTTTGPQGSGILRSMALADGLALRAAGVPRRGGRRRAAGHDARRQRRGAPAVPRRAGGARRQTAATAEPRRPSSAASRARARPRRSGGGWRCRAACRS